MRHGGIHLGQGKYRMMEMTMVCRTAEASFGFICDVVVVVGGGGDVVLVRAFCVYETD